MAKKYYKDMAEILAEIHRGSEMDFSDSSDSESGGSEEETVTRDVDPFHQ